MTRPCACSRRGGQIGRNEYTFVQDDLRLVNGIVRLYENGFSTFRFNRG